MKLNVVTYNRNLKNMKHKVAYLIGIAWPPTYLVRFACVKSVSTISIEIEVGSSLNMRLN